MKVAIIGAGISGLVTARQLTADHQVTVFEANHYVGGHTNTITVEEEGREFGVDTGFIVFNDRTYPRLIALLDQLGVASQKTEMSFSVKCEATGLEYRGADLNGLFAQRRNLLRPQFLRLLYDLLRLKKAAEPLLASDDETETVGEFLKRKRFSQQFIDQYFLPMGAAIWSCPFDRFNEFPMRFIAEFYQNHGLLGVTDRPQWRVICGGSREYVPKLIAGFEDRIHLNSPVTGFNRTVGGVQLTVKGEAQSFDHVVFACHSDQALTILGDAATALEREVLSAFPYEKNTAILHRQPDVMPENKRAWAAWNYFRPNNDSGKATVTYNMNILQSLDTKETYCVTLNDEDRIRSENVIRQFVYHHPTFDLRRRAMQQRQPELINHHHASYCGAYWGNGFHEDGVRSGQAVSQALSDEMGCEVTKA
ncbi:MAG: FAD-dependent oxidoreductase [Mariniblastus sp.]|nr:FAD-dependent oxidoreductase [Mariniblastus sp.]